MGKIAFDHIMSHPWKPRNGAAFQDKNFHTPGMLGLEFEHCHINLPFSLYNLLEI